MRLRASHANYLATVLHSAIAICETVATFSLMAASKKTVRVYEVLFDGAEGGPAGDGTRIKRFGPQHEQAANDFAASNTAYGKPAHVTVADVRRELAQRWGVA